MHLHAKGSKKTFNSGHNNNGNNHGNHGNSGNHEQSHWKLRKTILCRENAPPNVVLAAAFWQAKNERQRKQLFQSLRSESSGNNNGNSGNNNGNGAFVNKNGKNDSGNESHKYLLSMFSNDAATVSSYNANAENGAPSLSAAAAGGGGDGDGQLNAFESEEKFSAFCENQQRDGLLIGIKTRNPDSPLAIVKLLDVDNNGTWLIENDGTIMHISPANIKFIFPCHWANSYHDYDSVKKLSNEAQDLIGVWNKDIGKVSLWEKLQHFDSFTSSDVAKIYATLNNDNNNDANANANEIENFVPDPLTQFVALGVLEANPQIFPSLFSLDKFHAVSLSTKLLVDVYEDTLENQSPSNENANQLFLLRLIERMKATTTTKSASPYYNNRVIELEKNLKSHLFGRNTDFSFDKSILKWSPSIDGPRIKALLRYAVSPTAEETDMRVYEKFIKPLNVDGGIDAVFNFVTHLRICKPNDNVLALRHQLTSETSEKWLQISKGYLELPDAYKEFRRDFNGLAIAIDSDTTFDVDDAISADENDPHLFYVHIADASIYLPKGSELDDYVRTRASSIYLPEKVFHMLPGDLPMAASLSQERSTPTITVAIRITPDGKLIGQDVFLSRVNHLRRLTYDIADEIMTSDYNGNGNEKWSASSSSAATTSSSNSTKRTTNGVAAEFLKSCTKKEAMEIQSVLKRMHAVGVNRMNERFKIAPVINLPETKFEFKDDDANLIDMHVLSSQQNPSHLLVQEMMILANESIGAICAKNNIPIPFRSQLEPSQKLQNPVSVNTIDYMVMFKNFQLMLPASVSVVPAGHFSLQVPVYARSTSPIRRYQDLMIISQLKAFCVNRALPYTVNEIQNIIESTEKTSNEVKELQKKSEQFWFSKYLNCNINKSFKAVVLSPPQFLSRGAKYGIYLPEVGFRSRLIVGTNEPALPLSTPINVLPMTSNPRFELSKFSLHSI